MADTIRTRFQELPRQSTLWSDLASLGYANGQFFFPGMNTDGVPLTFDSLRKRYHLRTNVRVLGISMNPVDGDEVDERTESGAVSDEADIDKCTPCHRKVYLFTEDVSGPIRAHIKSVPILDVIGVMKGTYVPTGMDACLPSRVLEQSNTSAKVSDPNNQGYVDCITGYALSQLVADGKCPGFARCYGHFTSVAPNLRVDITDDFYSIRNLAWFHRGIGNRFEIEVTEDHSDSISGTPRSGKRSRKIVIGDEVFGFTEDLREVAEDPEVIQEEWNQREEGPLPTVRGSNGEMVEVDVIPGLEPVSDISEQSDEDDFCSDAEEMTDDEDVGDDETSEVEGEDVEGSDIESADGRNSSLESEAGNNEAGEGDNDSDSSSYSTGCDEAGKFYAVLPNIPIQSTVYEDLDGPIDTLLENQEVDEEQWRSILFQVVFSLAVAQKETGFVHNDLHTNNIMWEHTTQEALWYQVDSQWYCVPTFGRIIKIIDFGRSYIRYEGREFISDAFDFKNDAGGQYNYPPYYRNDQPTIPPNPSFDLPRLACSIVEGTLSPYDEPTTDVQKLLYRWLTDSRGKNILWNKNGEDRFQGFGLYKHIARYCKSAVPHTQLYDPVFQMYRTNDQPPEEAILCYKFTMPDENLMVLKKKVPRS